MKSEKKLKRGLAEISSLFGRPVAQTKRKISIIPPEIPTTKDSGVYPGIVFASFIPIDFHFDALDQMEFLNRHFDHLFDKKAFLSVGPSYRDYNRFSHFIPLPQWHEMIADDCLKTFQISQSTFLGFVPNSKIDHAAQISLLPPNKNKSSAMVLLDHMAFVPEMRHARMIQLLDYAIFVLPTKAEALLEAYKTMEYLMGENRKLHFSLLIAGEGAKDLCEFIYDEFSQIVSKFKGSDFSLLGWIEQGNAQLNTEVIFEGLDESQELPSKFQLTQELQLIA